jgi:hypothetical protein
MGERVSAPLRRKRQANWADSFRLTQLYYTQY